MSARKKKPRGTRPHLTHFEVRRGGALRLRLSVADDALAGIGDELGALFRKIAPGAVSTSTLVASPGAPSELVVSPTHGNDDDEYHADVRERLAELISSLCDASLSDALEIARTERARRAEVN